MKYFVFSDIHGFFNEWQKVLREKGFNINNPLHKIIICGDLFDRGHQPKEIIDFILSHKDKFILIRGNHEDLMQSMIDRNYNTSIDLYNGTADTIVDLYPEWQISEFNLKKIAEETRLQDVLDMCVNYFETEKFVFVHAWIPTLNDGMKYDANWRNATKKSWTKARWINPVEMQERKIFEPDKTIVCGHWHCSALWHAKYPNKYDEFGKKEYFEPFISKELIAIDACTAYTKKVNCIVIENEKIITQINKTAQTKEVTE